MAKAEITRVIGADSGEVIQTAAKDLQDYLFTSMGCSVALRRTYLGLRRDPL